MKHDSAHKFHEPPLLLLQLAGAPAVCSSRRPFLFAAQALALLEGHEGHAFSLYCEKRITQNLYEAASICENRRLLN